MSEKKLTHLNDQAEPSMVDVSSKKTTQRTATASATIELTEEIISLLESGDINTKKGPVFQTAILAGIMATKQTSQLIPLCHPLMINKAEINIHPIENNQLNILCTVRCEGKTGVEMEALTGASIAALTIYDMCKALSHNLTIREIKLIKKTGGKNDFEREHNP